MLEKFWKLFTEVAKKPTESVLCGDLQNKKWK